eukprot:1823209-Alexandrium_andersonii.AAC.1
MKAAPSGQRRWVPGARGAGVENRVWHMLQCCALGCGEGGPAARGAGREKSPGESDGLKHETHSVP